MISARTLSAGLRARFLINGTFLVFAAIAYPTSFALADEGGVSFWLPGQFGSLAAAPQQPGWSLATVNYYTSVDAGGSLAAARQFTVGKLNPTVTVNLNANLKANADVVLINPSYVFAAPVLGGQLALGMAGIVGWNNTSIGGTLTASVGGITITRQGLIDDGRTGFGDLYPKATLLWNSGVNNWMTYVTGDIPVGEYNSNHLANLGIGHGAIDGGVGYTYLNQQTGQEFSVVTGLTYNLTNGSTNYRNGVDWHVDWGLSQFLSKTMHLGAVGYFYDQLTADTGCAPSICPFKSRVAAIGPQVGFIIPGASTQAYLSFKGYWEFDAANRPSGWNAWVVLSLTPSTTPPLVRR